MVLILKAGRSLKFSGALILALIFTVAISYSEASTQAITATDTAVSAGNVIGVPLILNEAPAGVSGFFVDITLDNPGVAEIIGADFPNFGLSQIDQISSSEIRLIGADLSLNVEPGATNVLIANLQIIGTAAGTTGIGVDVYELHNDSGNITQANGIDATLTVTSLPQPPTPITVATLPNPLVIDFSGREYYTANHEFRGNESASPMVIGDPVYTVSSGNAGSESAPFWTFKDGGAYVDDGNHWISSQNGNSWSVTLTGDSTPREVKMYMDIFHNSGSLDYRVSLGSDSTVITKSNSGSTLYELAITITGSETVVVKPLGSRSWSAFSLAGIVVEGVVVANQPPIADAGSDQTLSDIDGTGVESVTLDGSGSFDPDGSIAIYEWREGATLLGNTATLVHNFSIGTHSVTLEVTDNGGASDTDSVSVTVAPFVAITAVAANTLPNPSVVDFSGREYYTAHKDLRGNESASPVVIGDPVYNVSSGNVGSDSTPIWTFNDSGVLVDNGNHWISSQNGNSWSVTLTGDNTPREVKIYMDIYHNKGSLDYLVSVGSASTVITKSSKGSTLYELAITITGSETVVVKPLGRRSWSAFSLAGIVVEP